MFINNNHTSFHLHWKWNLIKLRKFWKYYETDCLQNFLLLFMFLLAAKLVKNSHIYAKTVFTFAKSVLNQTWNSFNTKFEPQWEDRKSSYQVRQLLGVFWLLNCCNFSLKGCEKPKTYQNRQRNYVWRTLGRERIKKMFPETITHKITKTNSTFHTK